MDQLLGLALDALGHFIEDVGGLIAFSFLFAMQLTV
jgi:hypothetical protein